MLRALGRMLGKVLALGKSRKLCELSQPAGVHSPRGEDESCVRGWISLCWGNGFIQTTT